MKFSWKWLNEIIDLKHLSLQEITDKLILAGFEINSIDNIPEIKDKVIDIDITSNRQDVCSIIGLAREISSIINVPMNEKIHYQDFNLSRYEDKQQLYKSIQDLCIDNISYIKNKTSPIWLKNYLKGCSIETDNIFNDVIKYTKVKWGYEIEVFDTEKTESNNVDINLISNHVTRYKIKNTFNIILLGRTYKIEDLKKSTSSNKNFPAPFAQNINIYSRYDFIQAYNEALNILRIYTKGIHSKSFISIKGQINNRIIYLDKKAIQNTLGYTIRKPNNYLHTVEILQKLEQLHFKAKYHHISKKFIIHVPEHRANDIKRPIDIIEEISRIYGFNKFYSNLPAIITKGDLSIQEKTIKKIRKTLRDIGLNEVLNYSLEKTPIKLSNKKIKIYNPIIQDQGILQNNIYSNLIRTKKYNINQKNLNTEIFEIGRTFTNQTETKGKYEEQIKVAGLIGNNNFTRIGWDKKPHALNWFQAKGTLEEFFEKIKADILWIPLNEKNITFFNSDLISIIHKKRTACICNKINEEIIGIFGELKEDKNFLNCSSYIFEIDVNLLIETIKSSKNIDCIFKGYSTYPSITRDISIKLNATEYVSEIKSKILQRNNPLIESVDIFNEYKNQYNLNKRNIGLRITYRAKNTTLQEEDINILNEQINDLLKAYI